MYLFKYILRRLGLLVVTFAIIMVISFVLIKSLPLTIDASLGKDAELIRLQYEARGYYDPIPVQLWNYVVRIFTKGDFGVCVNLAAYRNKPVAEVFVTKLPPTILLNIYSTLFAVPVGIVLGILAALKKNKWQDQVISTGVMIFISVPSFVYAFLVQFLLCFKAGWFPITMNAGTNYFSPMMFRSMIPAVLSLSFGSIAGYARYTRAELTEVLTSDYLLLARTKGLTKAQATVRHALRNAMVPIFPSIVAEFISVMSGSLIIESIFGVPGVGGMYLAAINSQDYDAFMFLSGFYILISLVAGIVVDLSYGIIDPRIRMGAR